MNWFLNIPTRVKLLVSFGLIIVLLAIVAGTAYFGIKGLLSAQTQLYEEDFSNVIELLTFDGNQHDIRAGILTMLATTNQAVHTKWLQQVEQNSKENDRLVGQITSRYRARTNRLHILETNRIELLQKWVSIRETSRHTRTNELIPLIIAGRTEEAQALAIEGPQRTDFNNLRDLTQQLIDAARAEAAEALKESQRRGRSALLSFAVVGAVAVILALVLVGFLNRIIAAPLRKLLGVAERIASGDLTANLSPSVRTDEVGALNESFRRMLHSLREINREIQGGVNVLAASASQILTASSEMAASATETATAVSQTTATVEQVKQTAHVSKQKSKQVADIAQQAVDASQAGRRAVEQTVEGMDGVHNQMGAMAESIVRLSEQSQAIGDIIATVNDLAEQSNLLAVNAAIEAAKAGEQGKGFAVVAQEVRNLANQSKQATAQVRAILGDIQKATGSAVMATEQGTKAVESGVQKSDEAGDSIRLLAESIDQAAQAATQISASAEQQFIGMDQVAQAMESIKQAADQNAKATRQSESGARNLHDLGQKLKQIVGKFKM